VGERWKPDIEDWDLIDEGKVDFILQESKLFLQRHLENFDKLDSKAFVVLGVLFSVISGLTGFFISRFSFATSQQNWKLLLPILVIIVICFVACFFLIQSVLPKEIYLLGNETKNLLNRRVCKSETRLIKLGEALDYQNRIDECVRQNQAKTRKMMVGVLIALFAPLVGGLLALLL
jgi:hypothetical protein